MKYLIMTEGVDELTLINILIEKNILKYKKSDLLYLTPIHARQMQQKPAIMRSIRQISGENIIEIFRVGDNLTDLFKIPKEFKTKIKSVHKVCTLPELEMLIIINENLVSDFEKVKSKESPSKFCSHRVKGFSKNVNKWYKDYLGNLSIKQIVTDLKEYRRIKKKSHDNDQLFLTCLIKESILKKY